MNMKKSTLFLVAGFIFLFSPAYVSAQDSSGKFVNYLKEHVKVTGYAQVGYDYNSYNPTIKGPFNRFSIDRAILIVKYEPIKHLRLGFMGNFAKFNLQELYADYTPLDAIGVKIGQFKVPFSIENNMSPSVMPLITGSRVVNYFAGKDGSDKCFGKGAGRDAGIELRGSFLKVGRDAHNLFKYRVGVFNGEPINTKETNNHKDIVGMLTVTPITGLDLTGSVYFGQSTALADNFYGAFNQGDQYRRNRWSVGLKFDMGHLAFHGEYIEGMDKDIRSRGAYLTVLGRTCKYLDIVASMDYLDRNAVINDVQYDYTFGLQWNIYYKCRLRVQYAYQQRDTDNPMSAFFGTPSSHLVMVQMQMGF